MKKILTIMLFILSVYISSLSANDILIFSGSSYGNSHIILKKYISAKNKFIKDTLYFYETGDWLGRDNLAAFTKGKLPIKIMNILEYRGAGIGNHEFDYGIDVLKKCLNNVRFKVLSANIDLFGNEKESYTIETYDIVVINKIKIGIFSIASLKNEVPYRIDEKNAKDTAEKISILLKNKGVQRIICLSDVELTKNMSILKATKNIDIIISGSQDDINTFELKDNRSLILCHEDDFISYDGKFILRHKIKKSQKDFFSIKELPEDKKTLKKIKDAQKKIVDISKNYNNSLKKIICSNLPLYSISKLVLEGMRKGAYGEIAFINNGALNNIKISGLITEKNIFETIKYNDSVFRVLLRGSDILKIIKESEKAKSNGNKYLLYSGIEKRAGFYFNRLNKYNTIKKNYFINGRIIDPNEKYITIVNDFLLKGGDGYEIFTKAKKINNTSSGNLNQLTKNYIKKITLGKQWNQERLFWKYNIDSTFQYTGNILFNRSIYPEISSFGNIEPFHSFNTVNKFYTQWKNRFHLFYILTSISMGFIKTDINPFENNINDISLYAAYQFNFAPASPYIELRENNMKFYFINDDYQYITFSPRFGIIHNFPHNFTLQENFLIKILPWTEQDKLLTAISIKGKFPLYIDKILNFKNSLELTLYFTPRINFSIEYNAILRINIFKFLWAEISGIYFYDTDRNNGALGLFIGSGSAVSIGRIFQ